MSVSFSRYFSLICLLNDGVLSRIIPKLVTLDWELPIKRGSYDLIKINKRGGGVGMRGVNKRRGGVYREEGMIGP